MEIGCYQGIRHRKAFRSTVSGPIPMPDTQGTEEDGRRKEEGSQVDGQDPQAGCHRPATRKRERKNITFGVAHIKSSSTTPSCRSPIRRATCWRGVAGNVGFKGSRKSTPFAAQLLRSNVPSGDGARACAGSTCWSAVRARVVRRLSAPWRSRHRSRRHQGRDPHPAQRVPPQKAASV